MELGGKSGIGDAARRSERTWSVMGQPDLDGILHTLPNNGDSWIVLLHFFDFDRAGFVTKENWQQGLIALGLAGLAEDEALWGSLVKLYASSDDKAAISIAKIRYKVPFDPIVQTLMRSVVHTSRNMRNTLQASQQELKHWQEREEQRQRQIGTWQGSNSRNSGQTLISHRVRLRVAQPARMSRSFSARFS